MHNIVLMDKDSLEPVPIKDRNKRSIRATCIHCRYHFELDDNDIDTIHVLEECVSITLKVPHLHVCYPLFEKENEIRRFDSSKKRKSNYVYLHKKIGEWVLSYEFDNKSPVVHYSNGKDAPRLFPLMEATSSEVDDKIEEIIKYQVERYRETFLPYRRGI